MTNHITFEPKYVFDVNPDVKVRTRFAPSPTGELHVGGARTALYSWLFAKHHNGEFVLRIEDTDLERSDPQKTIGIMNSMQWLNLEWDHGPYYQTKRFDRYNEVIEKMLEAGLAYYCFISKEELDQIRAEQEANKEKPRAPRTYRDMPLADAKKRIAETGETPVVRFKNPMEGSVIFDDAIRGKIEVSNSELDDLIIRRADGSPTYNFCVVIDDWDMAITHVVRGEDHINNTPRQINILKALGAEIPVYAHVSMILGEDGKKLSKRHGAVSAMEFHKDGYLADALINYLVRLGWGHGDQEIFSREEMIQFFELNQVSHSASRFMMDKLQWLNQHYICNAPKAEVEKALAWQYTQAGVDTTTGPALSTIIDMLGERCKTLVEMVEKSRYFFEDFTEFDEAAAKKQFKAAAVTPLKTVKEKLAAITEENWTAQTTHQAIQDTAAELEVGMGKVGMPLRVAVTGTGQSPSMDVTLAAIGRERTLARLQRAIDFIEQNA